MGRTRREENFLREAGIQESLLDDRFIAQAPKKKERLQLKKQMKKLQMGDMIPMVESSRNEGEGSLGIFLEDEEVVSERK